LADPSIERVIIDGVQFPLGVYPIEPMQPRQGYTVDFESADGNDDEGEWEEWPDRYVYDVVISADRLPAMVRSLLALLPGRIYPILDVLGHDAYREVDPYISYELMGLDRLMESITVYHDYLFEDGLCGFGAMCDDPFVYLFVDEHKIVTVRVHTDMRSRVERILSAFDLAESDAEGTAPAGADAAAHEHRGVLLAPDDHPDLLTSEEIVERLGDAWRLTLNVDPETNFDDEGRDLGVTAWRYLVRTDDKDRSRYAEILLSADSLLRADELVEEAIDHLLPEIRPRDPDELWEHTIPVSRDRLTPSDMAILLERKTAVNLKPMRVFKSRWIA
jgi:hypothetical protein